MTLELRQPPERGLLGRGGAGEREVESVPIFQYLNISIGGPRGSPPKDSEGRREGGEVALPPGERGGERGGGAPRRSELRRR